LPNLLTKIKLFLGIVASLGVTSGAAADDYFYDNGVFIGLETDASRNSRAKPVDFGLNTVGFGTVFKTETTDWTASPTLRAGYKFDDTRSLVINGDWARYSQRRSSDSAGTAFSFSSVDGIDAIGATDPTTASVKRTDWTSNVYNLELEYKHILWSDSLGGITGVLGFRYRQEDQEFGASHRGFILIVDMDERLKERLYGPQTGIGISFKPSDDSNIGIGIHTKVGYLFKSAELRARDLLIGTPHAQDDHSSDGTFFTAVELSLTYVLSERWSAGGRYSFNFIDKAAHISNNTVFGAGRQPARIENSAVVTQTLGLSVTYRF